ncbi:type II toxin-antitoxin system RelE/ParE family toxin [bacterium]|nr:type II toxin-antitoxin system RelE/ParE family toxin [bacterium]
MSHPVKIIIYGTASGKEPLNDWLDSLDGSVRGKVTARIDRLEQGNFGNAKGLKDGLFELKFKSPAFRLYYAEVGKEIVLLISGGDKRRQSEDIQKAKEYLTDYRSRYGIKKKF